MEIEVSSSSNFVDLENRKNKAEEDRDRIRVKRETLKAVLEQCQRALQLLGNNTDGVDEVNDDHNDNDNDRGKPAVEDDDDDDDDDKELSRENSVASPGAADREAYELCDLLKSRVGCPDFLEKLECDYMLVPQNLSEEGSSWDMVSESDLWEDGIVDSDQEDYVLVRQEDLVEGIACFMAAYLLSFRQTNDLTPNQLQEALSKTFSVKKKKGKLRKAWDGSKVIYNVASWGATAIGIYQNPVILRAASKAFWTSCHVISKLL